MLVYVDLLSQIFVHAHKYIQVNTQAIVLATCLLCAGVGTATLPLVADAADPIVPCGNEVYSEDRGTFYRYFNECNICDLQRLMQNILNWFVAISVILAALLFVNAGVLYVMSPGNLGNIQRAHKIFTNTLIGLIIILAAWLFADVLMKTLLPTQGIKDGAGGYYGPWNEILCTGSTNYYDRQKASTVTYTAGELVLEQGGGAETFGARTAALQAAGYDSDSVTGYCSEAHLSAFFPPSEVATAACVCHHESHGQSSIASGVDKCLPGGESVSYGLFQINISAHNLDGYNCIAAVSGGPYTGSDHTCTITNESVWNRCIAAAQNPTTNITYAAQLQAQRGWGQWGAYRYCR